MKRLIQIVLIGFTTSATLAQESTAPRRDYAGTAFTGDKLEQPFIRWGDAILIEDVMVNGEGPFRFLLDTGAEGAGRIDSRLVKNLRIPVIGESTGVGILGEKRAMTRHRLDSLAIGGLSFTGVEVSSRDYSGWARRGLRPVDGILGFHLFSEYLLTVNYAARTITVERGALPAPDGKNVLPFAGGDGKPKIEVAIGERKQLAFIDSGAQGGLAVSAAFAKELDFKDKPKVIGQQGGAAIRSATLDGTLHIGAVDIADPQMIIAGPLPMTNIGIHIIASLVLTFDQKNGRVRVDRAAERKSWGFSTSRSSGEPPEVVRVAPGSVAEAGGLKVGDRFVAINGRAAETLDSEQYTKLLDLSKLVIEYEREGKRTEIRLTLE